MSSVLELSLSVARNQLDQELADFLVDIFEIMEIRAKVGNQNGILFEIRSNEGNHVIPHVHAKYGEYYISISLVDGKILDGNLPNKKEKQAVKWVLDHKEDCLTKWNDFTFSAISHHTKSQLDFYKINQ